MLGVGIPRRLKLYTALLVYARLLPIKAEVGTDRVRTRGLTFARSRIAGVLGHHLSGPILNIKLIGNVS